MRFDKSDIRRRGLGLDNDGLEVRQEFGRLDLLLHVIERQAQPIGDLRQQTRQLLRIVAQQQHAEGRIIVDNHAAIAVQHGAAWRDDGNGANAIALCKLRVLVGMDDLQLPKAE